eukprot:3615957-Prymnesium_polylepis.1
MHGASIDGACLPVGRSRTPRRQAAAQPACNRAATAPASRCRARNGSLFISARPRFENETRDETNSSFQNQCDALQRFPVDKPYGLCSGPKRAGPVVDGDE